jgi:Sec-independent protein translocase protein TatA
MPVFGLNGGEWFIVSFVTVMVVSAKYWPALGLRVGRHLGGGRTVGPTSPSEPPRSP